MKDTYEKDVTEALGNSRNLILLGVRADADINHLEKRIKKLEDELSGWTDDDSLTPNP